MHWELASAEKTYNGIYRLGVEFRIDDVAILQERLAVEDEYLNITGNVSAQHAAAALGRVHADIDSPNKLRKWVAILRTWLSDIHILDLMPSLMREYISKNRSEIGVHGENLSAVLLNLASKPDQYAQKCKSIASDYKQQSSKFRKFDKTFKG